MTSGSKLSNFVVFDVIRRAQWNFWFHCGGDFFQGIILFREVTIVFILAFTKACANFPKGKALRVRLTENESKKVLEAVVCKDEKLGLGQAAMVTMPSLSAGCLSAAGKDGDYSVTRF